MRRFVALLALGWHIVGTVAFAQPAPIKAQFLQLAKKGEVQVSVDGKVKQQELKTTTVNGPIQPSFLDPEIVFTKIEIAPGPLADGEVTALVSLHGQIVTPWNYIQAHSDKTSDYTGSVFIRGAKEPSGKFAISRNHDFEADFEVPVKEGLNDFVVLVNRPKMRPPGSTPLRFRFEAGKEGFQPEEDTVAERNLNFGSVRAYGISLTTKRDLAGYHYRIGEEQEFLPVRQGGEHFYYLGDTIGGGQFFLLTPAQQREEKQVELGDILNWDDLSERYTTAGVSEAQQFRLGLSLALGRDGYDVRIGPDGFVPNGVKVEKGTSLVIALTLRAPDGSEETIPVESEMMQLFKPRGEQVQDMESLLYHLWAARHGSDKKDVDPKQALLNGDYSEYGIEPRLGGASQEFTRLIAAMVNQTLKEDLQNPCLGGYRLGKLWSSARRIGETEGSGGVDVGQALEKDMVSRYLKAKLKP